MFKLSPRSLELLDLKKEFANTKVGAFACFEGWVRDHNDGKKVTALSYEAFEPLCMNEVEKIFAEAKKQFAIFEAKCFHRVGELKVGEMAVWVGVTAAHRDDAFKACRYIIDQVKARLPIWKKEYYENGNSGWVGCENCAGQHYEHQNEAEVSVYLSDLLKTDLGKYIFIDIRELVEHVANPVETIAPLHLPLSQWKNLKFHFDNGHQYLVFCEKGLRSLNLVKELRQQGIPNVYSVVHGVRAVKEFVGQSQKI